MSNFKDVEEKIEMTARANVGSMQQISKPKRGKRSLKMEAQSLCWPIIRWAWIAVGNLLSRPRHRKKKPIVRWKTAKNSESILVSYHTINFRCFSCAVFSLPSKIFTSHQSKALKGWGKFPPGVFCVSVALRCRAFLEGWRVWGASGAPQAAV